MVVRRKVRTAVEDHVNALRERGALDSRGEALAVLALNLAGHLDEGKPPTMTASWAKELRATLDQLGTEGGDDDGDPDSWVDELGGGASVRDAPQP